MKKLTLNVSPKVIEQAQRQAKKRGTSVSSMFSSWIRLLSRRHGVRHYLGPLTREASGLIRLPRGKGERQVLEDALIEKYDLDR